LHAVEHVNDGARKLSEGLAKIVVSTSRCKAREGHESGAGAFRALFISDPESALKDELLVPVRGLGETDSALVQEILDRKVTRVDTLTEIFSTHPNVTKRLQALKRLQATQASRIAQVVAPRCNKPN